MKKCQYCGTELEDRFLFCTNCGKAYKEVVDEMESASLGKRDTSVEHESMANLNSGNVEVQEDVLFENAAKYFELGQYQEAYDAICELMVKCPKPLYIDKKKEYQDKLVQELTKQGDELSRAGQMVLAKENYEKVLALQPANAYIISRLDSIKQEKSHKVKSAFSGIIACVLLALLFCGIGFFVYTKLTTEQDIDNSSDNYVAQDENESVVQENEVEEEDFIGVDLAMFDLKGHVKQVEYPRDKDQPNGPAFVCKFDEEGKLVSGTLLEFFEFHPNPTDLKPQRNEEGKIVSFNDSEIDATFTPVFHNNGKIMALDVCLPTMGCMSYNYTMDSYGVISNGSTEVSVHGYRSKIFSEYEYTKYDDKGNWIERKVSGTSYEYNYNEDGEEVEEKEEFSGGIETRRIIYY